MVFVATSHGPRASSRTLAYIKASIRVRSPMLVNVKQSRPLFRQKNTDFLNKPIYAFTRSLIFRPCLYNIYSHIIIRLESPPYLDPILPKSYGSGFLIYIYCSFCKYSSGHSFPYFFSISSKVIPLISGRLIKDVSLIILDLILANTLLSLVFLFLNIFLSLILTIVYLTAHGKPNRDTAVREVRGGAASDRQSRLCVQPSG